jgi:hypothetical protein
MKNFTRYIIFFLLGGMAQAQTSHPVGNDCIVIDTFSSCHNPKVSLPCGWRGEDHDVSMFSLRSENGNHFIRDSVYGKAIGVGKQLTLDISNTPILKWRWRVWALPPGGNEKVKNMDDCGAAVFVVFRGTFPFKKVIKYTWSSTLPVGTVTENPLYSGVKIKIIRSGKDSLGVWIDESIDVFKDFKDFFHKSPPEIQAIAIMSDSNNTKSFAWADYDDFFVCKQGKTE